MRYTLYLIICGLFLISIFSCSKSEIQPLDAPSEPAQKLYLESQKELQTGSYKQSYNSYRAAVAADRKVANINHLSSILYSWIIAESEGEDTPILTAQRKVWLEPNQLALRGGLQKIAVDRQRGTIYAFGIGIAPEDIDNMEQRRELARRTAMADAQTWVARLARWAKDGIKCPFDISLTVVGVETIKEHWIGDTIYIVKVQAPIDCLG